MTTPAPERSRRIRLIVSLAAAGLVLLVLTGIGIYGLITGPRDQGTPADSDVRAHPTQTATVPSSATPTAHELPALPSTDDPERFARAVAQTLFTWDTFTTLTPDDHRAVVLEAADPSGAETPGLINDLGNYFPSEATWRQLSEYRTAQTLSIDKLHVPAEWFDAVEAADGQIADGLIAYTVEGVRHRSGQWVDQPAESEHPVAFTMFLSCPPYTDSCVLLRLSKLDQPLR
ncbi:hypothetical protein ACTJI8_20335 [Microbacterium sp. 22303]|uniref:hypothetical protein n=1 Tax=Microbacterium sp. 22303 TaxID=3453905 RepID=UPI003F875F99